jgi:hypothetical protein
MKLSSPGSAGRWPALRVERNADARNPYLHSSPGRASDRAVKSVLFLGGACPLSFRHADTALIITSEANIRRKTTVRCYARDA